MVVMVPDARRTRAMPPVPGCEQENKPRVSGGVPGQQRAALPVQPPEFPGEVPSSTALRGEPRGSVRGGAFLHQASRTGWVSVLVGGRGGWRGGGDDGLKVAGERGMGVARVSGGRGGGGVGDWGRERGTVRGG